MIKLVFITGARSDYGPVRSLLKALNGSSSYELDVLVHGMHLVESYGSTINEIIQDDLNIVEKIATLDSANNDKSSEFTRTVDRLCNLLKGKNYDAAFIVGDRLESYSAALACHFCKLPIIHSGGGHKTSGAVDDIYRFNITNLSELHLVTSKLAYERLLNVPLINNKNVYFVGAPTVDNIYEFLSYPTSLEEAAGIRLESFGLITFHPVTSKSEPIVDLLECSVKSLLDQGYQALVTYPNNDTGSQEIIDKIDELNHLDGVYIYKHLGAQGYYAALRECDIVIGNSSSGLMEAPYFKKPILNVGNRQDGREIDPCVKTVAADRKSLKQAVIESLSNESIPSRCLELYGDGNSVSRIISILNKHFSK